MITTISRSNCRFMYLMDAAVGAANRHRLQPASRGLAGLWHLSVFSGDVSYCCRCLSCSGEVARDNFIKMIIPIFLNIWVPTKKIMTQ